MAFNKERLRAQLRASGQTGAWLARRIGVSRASISYYLSGKRTPDPDRIEQMAVNLECTIEFLTAPQDYPQAG